MYTKIFHDGEDLVYSFQYYDTYSEEDEKYEDKTPLYLKKKAEKDKKEWEYYGQCKAITLKGTRCKNRADKCNVHKN